MKVFLIPIDDERVIVCSEGPEDGEGGGDPAPSRGVRGWLERKFARLQESIRRAESGPGLHFRRLWAWLQARVHPDESLLRGLRFAEEIALYHPTAMTRQEVQAVWEGYLKAQRRYHLLWLMLNLLVCPLSVLLAPIPGPNLIGYWFAYRAVCHALALLGLRRALGGQVSTTFHPSEALDTPLGEADEQAIAGVASRCDLGHLPEFLRRCPPRCVPRRREPVAGP